MEGSEKNGGTIVRDGKTRKADWLQDAPGGLGQQGEGRRSLGGWRKLPRAGVSDRIRKSAAPCVRLPDRCSDAAVVLDFAECPVGRSDETCSVGLTESHEARSRGGNPGSAPSCCVALGKSLNLSDQGPSATGKTTNSTSEMSVASEEQMLMAVMTSYLGRLKPLVMDQSPQLLGPRFPCQ